MNKLFILIIFLLGASATTRAQEARKAGEGQSIRHRIFSDYDQAISRIRAGQALAPKPIEATLTSPQALKRHIFPGSNGGGGIPRNTAGARKASIAAPPTAAKLSSATSGAEAAQKSKAEPAKPFDVGAQGTEPPITAPVPAKAKPIQPKN
ncbi:hypothetical protein [uncultured Chitinophaga sp.]|uniref:hypothetical protein n=1 Tax=uncultured Chitinophaga sp. TaxID=339340 RepID=UPI0026124799|nr:hypothetical protein [uncultured Chitinophaga sp.]